MNRLISLRKSAVGLLFLGLLVGPGFATAENFPPSGEGGEGEGESPPEEESDVNQCVAACTAQSEESADQGFLFSATYFIDLAETKCEGAANCAKYKVCVNKVATAALEVNKLLAKKLKVLVGSFKVDLKAGIGELVEACSDEEDEDEN